MVYDIWDSPQSLQAFGEVLMPILAEVGVDPGEPAKSLQLLFYRAALPLSSRTLSYAAGVIRVHRKSIGSRWRKLNPGR